MSRACEQSVGSGREWGDSKQAAAGLTTVSVAFGDRPTRQSAADCRPLSTAAQPAAYCTPHPPAALPQRRPGPPVSRAPAPPCPSGGPWLAGSASHPAAHIHTGGQRQKQVLVTDIGHAHGTCIGSALTAAALTRGCHASRKLARRRYKVDDSWGKLHAHRCHPDNHPRQPGSTSQQDMQQMACSQ